MNIAVIGAGAVGGAIARAARQTGHDVVITATTSATAQQVAGAAGVAAASSNAAAAANADAVVLAVPFTAVPEVARDIQEVSEGKIVIDVTNPIKPDYSGLAVTGRSGAELVQELLPQSAVVKAFNTVFAAKQADPVTGGTPLDGFYAGDDEAAKKAVADLLAGIGYRPVDAGGLAAALALEHMAFLNISLNERNNWPWQSGWKLVGPAG
jgi:hypothetical protein